MVVALLRSCWGHLGKYPTIRYLAMVGGMFGVVYAEVLGELRVGLEATIAADCGGLKQKLG